MNKLSSRLSRLLLSMALPVVSSATLAQAQAQSGLPTELDRVDVTGRTFDPVVKFDVHKACPQIGAELQESLGAHLGRYASPGEARVEFVLAGKEISSIKVDAGFPLFGVPIKKSVRRLSCDSAQAGPQRYAFRLLVLDPDAAGHQPAFVRQALDEAPLLVMAR